MAFDFFKRKAPRKTKSVAQKTKGFLAKQLGKLKSLAKRKTMGAFSSGTVTKPEIGKMYFYGYDPKYKETLPLYDRLPLIIPIEHYNNGWLGMNLHYLPPRARYRFLQELLKISGKKISKGAKMELSYKLLKPIATSKLFKPTIHRYLASHVVTPISEVDATDWEAVVFLPTARWAKGKPY